MPGNAQVTPVRRSASAGVRVRGDVLLVISAGGALGSLGRWGVGEVLAWSGDGFPWATFVENLSGGFLLGALMVLLLDVWAPRPYLRPFLGVGVLGGYTTFSTYMLETHDLLAGGQAALAATYLFGTLVTGVLAVWLGVASARFGVDLRRRVRRRRAAPPAPSTPPDDPTSRRSR